MSGFEEKQLHNKTAEMDPVGANSSGDGIDRRGFLKCMAWAGTGFVWTFAGGVPTSRVFGEPMQPSAQSDFTFVQISDSHIGFNKPANTDVTATLQAALSRIDAHPGQSGFSDSHRRPDAFLQACGVRHARPAARLHAGKCSTFPASTIRPSTTERCISSAMAKAPRGTAGTASTTRACTSSAWSTWCSSKAWASSDRRNSTG